MLYSFIHPSIGRSQDSKGTKHPPIFVVLRRCDPSANFYGMLGVSMSIVWDLGWLGGGGGV